MGAPDVRRAVLVVDGRLTPADVPRLRASLEEALEVAKEEAQ